MTKWQPIDDLPGDYRELSDMELTALAGVWEDQRDLLSQAESLRIFNERLRREWAIETGIVERVYTLDRGTTSLLIEMGIDASLIPQSATDKDPELVARMIQDHEHTIEGLFDFVKGERTLTTGYVKQLHASLTRHQETTGAVDSLGRSVEVPLRRGDYKSQPNNPVRPDGTIHEYSPPEHVASEMDRLVGFHVAHESAGISPEIEAAWLHHRFTQIHPFQDGNGRVARAIATLVFLRAGWFPLVVNRDERERYISALEQADSGDLGKLVSLFAAIQRRDFVNALSIAGEVLQRDRVDQVIRAAKDRMEKRREALRREWNKAKELAVSLQDDAEARLLDAAERTTSELGVYSRRYEFFVDRERDGGNRSHYFRAQIIETAKDLGYVANTNDYRAWVRLVLKTETQCEILLSFHGVGHEYRGVLVASMCFFRREEIERGEREVAGRVTVSDEVFQINYREDEGSTKLRFRRWLEQGLLVALGTWTQSL